MAHRNEQDEIRKMQEMLNAMTRRAQARERELERLGNIIRSTNVNEGPAGPSREVPTASDTGIHSKLKEFCEFHPHSFGGEMEPEVAERWIEHLETIFGVMDCSSEQKVRLAVFKLEDKAKHWWRIVRPDATNMGAGMTWEWFKKKFLSYYFPESVRARKEVEFLTLRQGEMTEEQYIDRFLELAKYSTYLQIHNDDRWKAQRLFEGAKPELKERLAVVTPSSFEEMRDRICTVAQRMREAQEERRVVVGPSSRYGPSGRVNKKKFKASRKRVDRSEIGNSSSATTSTRPLCDTCGYRHRNRACPVCYICGRIGHFQRRCSQNRPSGS